MTLYQGKNQVGGDLWTERSEVADFEDTRTATPIRRVLSLACESGQYEAEVVLRESSAGKQNRLSWKIDVPDYAHLPLSLSSLWVAECPQPLPDTICVPPRGWMLSHRYGEPLGPLCVVGEVYRSAAARAAAAASDSVRLTWRILGNRGEEVRKGALAVEPGSRVPFRFRPDLSSLWLGSYTLELVATAGRNQARRRMEFRMDETVSSVESDLSQSIEILSLVASSDELREIKDASPTMRKDAWSRFWKRHDPTPETPENEFKEEFFARVDYANEHYSVLGPGWRTDRGRTYIRYGPPDQVESYPINIDGPPYEIWTYHKLGRSFVFVDYDGFGRYELARP
jgi:GWxTD domain-containing protein